MLAVPGAKAVYHDTLYGLPRVHVTVDDKKTRCGRRCAGWTEYGGTFVGAVAGGNACLRCAKAR